MADDSDPLPVVKQRKKKSPGSDPCYVPLPPPKRSCTAQARNLTSRAPPGEELGPRRGFPAAGAAVRDSLLPLEGDTVQLLAAGGATASLLLLPLPPLQPPPSKTHFPGEAAQPCPATPAPPGAQPPAGEKRGSQGSSDGVTRPRGRVARASRGSPPLPDHVRLCANFAAPTPPLGRGAEQRGGGAAPCGAAGAGGGSAGCVRTAGGSGGRCRQSPHSSVRAAAAGTCCLVKGLGRRATTSRINTGEDKGVLPALPASVRVWSCLCLSGHPRRSRAPSAVRCGAVRAG